jgi:hypothetical protein
MVKSRASLQEGGIVRRIVLAVALVVSVTLLTAGSAQSATSKSAFQVFVEPTLTSAAKGLVIETDLQGSFDVAAKTASGGGSFAIMSGDTVLESGTFTLTRLVAFQFYGCGEIDGITLPPDFCGGRALFAIHATAASGEQGDGLLEVNCQIHDPGGQAPPGTSEGVKVNTRGINFNKHITGDNLFVRQ